MWVPDCKGIVPRSSLLFMGGFGGGCSFTLFKFLAFRRGFAFESLHVGLGSAICALNWLTEAFWRDVLTALSILASSLSLRVILVGTGLSGRLLLLLLALQDAFALHLPEHLHPFLDLVYLVGQLVVLLVHVVDLGLAIQDLVTHIGRLH